VITSPVWLTFTWSLLSKVSDGKPLDWNPTAFQTMKTIPALNQIALMILHLPHVGFSMPWPI
jgi:hypothetical protein